VSMTGRVYCRARWVSGGQIQDMVTPRGHRATPLMTPRNLDAMRCARNKWFFCIGQEHHGTHKCSLLYS